MSDGTPTVDPVDAADSAVSAALSGARDVFRALSGPTAQAAFLDAATRHRVRPLLAWQLRERGELGQWPSTIRQALADAERAEAAVEIVRSRDLCRVLAAFASAKIDVLALKGVALACTIYPAPWLRPREDTDLLVRPADAARASEVLDSLGYGSVPRQSGRVVTHQRSHARSGPHGRDAYDLHWKIANPAPFADLISVDDLMSASTTTTVGGGCTMRVPSRSHALLIACWHRVAHHYDAVDLLWLYDVHLLAARFDKDDIDRTIDLARRTQTVPICLRGLRLASMRFGTSRSPALVEQLERVDLGTESSSSAAAYLDPAARKVDLLAADLKALPGWRARARLVREHLFPPADYMFETYGIASRMLLPGLYAWRIASGARRWFRRLR